MRFLERSEVAARFRGKSVAIVGSGPGVLDNEPGVIDSHDIVIRISNYRIVMPATGKRTDCFYSFFGGSIKKTADELKRDGVTLCLCKLPDAKLQIDSAWHEKHNKLEGIDYRPHYRRRKDWWFCPTYIPTVEDFMAKFNLLGQHQPTTGFACILDVLSFEPRSVYLTGFDGFTSGKHNVTDKWAPKNLDDPIRHEPMRELKWLAKHWDSYPFPIMFDPAMAKVMQMAAP